MRVAGGGQDGGQVQGDQLGDGQQQPGYSGLADRGQLGEVDHPGFGQLLASGPAAGLFGAAPQPLEAFVGADLGDAGAVERGAFGAQCLGDLVDRAAGVA